MITISKIKKHFENLNNVGIFFEDDEIQTNGSGYKEVIYCREKQYNNDPGDFVVIGKEPYGNGPYFCEGYDTLEEAVKAAISLLPNDLSLVVL